MSPDALGFDMSAFTAAQAEQDKRRLEAEKAKAAATAASQAVATKQATAGIAALTAARGVKTAASAAEAQNRDAQNYLMKDAGELARIEQEAITLSNSSKPGDKLTLWMKQLSDPRYTKEYNSARQSKLTQSSAVMNHFEAIRQQAYTTQLEAIKDDLDLNNAKDSLSLLPVQQQLEIANLVKEQGDSAVTALAQAIKGRHDMIAQDVATQDNVLSNLTDDQVLEAQAAAQKTPEKTTVVGGVSIKLGILDTVVAARNDRAYLIQNRELETRIKEQNLEQGVQSLEAGRQQELARDEAFSVQRRTRYLQTMSPGELTRIQVAGGAYTYPDGSKEMFDLDTVKHVYETKKEALDRQIMTESQLAGISDGRSIVTEHAAFLEKAPDSKPGSAIWNSQITYHDMIRRSAQALSNEELNKPENAKLLFDTTRVAYDGLQGARKQYEADIETEAKRVGAGNEFRTTLERYRLRGEPMSGDLIEAEIQNRTIAGKPLTDLLGSDQSAAYLQAYNAKFVEIQKREGAGMGLSAPDRKAMQQEASTAAYALILKSTGEKTASALTARQVIDASHPLFNKITPAEYAALEAESDAQGTKEFLAINKLSPEDLTKILNGAKINNMTVEDLNQIPIQQQSALFSRISAKFGFDTADAVATWWGGNKAINFIQNQTEILTAAAVDKGGPDYVSTSATIPTVQDTLNYYGRSVQAGIRDFQNDRVVREMSNFRAFGNNPQALQVAILSNDKSITDRERQETYTKFIEPLLADAKQKGLDYEKTNIYIEKALRSTNPDDPPSKSLLKKVLRTREETVDTIGDIVKSQGTGLFSGGIFSAFGATQTQRTILGKDTPAQWYSDMLLERDFKQ